MSQECLLNLGGYDDKLLDGYTAEFVMPDVLAEESIKADSVLCY